MELYEYLVDQGALKSKHIIGAFKIIDRKDFIPPLFKDYAYDDEALAIGLGQTISQPYTVAIMLEMLQPGAGDRILEIGFGSGWLTCLLAEIVGAGGRVYATERLGDLVDFGKANIEKYKFISKGIVDIYRTDGVPDNIEAVDGIIASAAVTDEIPQDWIDALKTGGRMVFPMDNALWMWTKKRDGTFSKEKLDGFVFVPLIQENKNGKRRAMSVKRSNTEEKSKKTSYKLLFRIFAMIIIIAALFLFILYEMGIIFPPGLAGATEIRIKKGAGAEEIADILQDNGIIRSRNFFVWYAYLNGDHTGLSYGNYTFLKNECLSVPCVVKELAGGFAEVEITITEGSNVALIAKKLNEVLGVDPDEFKISAHVAGFKDDYDFLAAVPAEDSLEGYLFPDTYRFFENAEPDDVIKIMLNNFGEKISKYGEEIAEQGKSVHDVITMASILEKEAITLEDKKLVSGILWKRIDKGMLLQADATLAYFTGRTSLNLTKDDLNSDNPYNTYKVKGLPKGPISNPGLESIEAALFPEESPYYYYLSDSKYNIYYSKTFDEHKDKKLRFL